MPKQKKQHIIFYILLVVAFIAVRTFFPEQISQLETAIDLNGVVKSAEDKLDLLARIGRKLKETAEVWTEVLIGLTALIYAIYHLKWKR